MPQYNDEGIEVCQILSIDDINGGDVVRQINAAIHDVANDIANLGKTGDDTRTITMKLVFKPKEHRQTIDVHAEVNIKLGGRASTISQLVLGIEDNKLFMRNDDDAVDGQMSLQEVMREIATDGEPMTLMSGDRSVTFVKKDGAVVRVGDHVGH